MPAKRERTDRVLTTAAIAVAALAVGLVIGAVATTPGPASSTEPVQTVTPVQIPEGVAPERFGPLKPVSTACHDAARDLHALFVKTMDEVVTPFESARYLGEVPATNFYEEAGIVEEYARVNALWLECEGATQ